MSRARNRIQKEKREVEISNNSLGLILNCNLQLVVELLTLFQDFFGLAASFQYKLFDIFLFVLLKFKLPCICLLSDRSWADFRKLTIHQLSRLQLWYYFAMRIRVVDLFWLYTFNLTILLTSPCLLLKLQLSRPIFRASLPSLLFLQRVLLWRHRRSPLWPMCMSRIHLNTRGWVNRLKSDLLWWVQRLNDNLLLLVFLQSQ